MITIFSISLYVSKYAVGDALIKALLVTYIWFLNTKQRTLK
jgi:hypothetical protein